MEPTYDLPSDTPEHIMKKQVAIVLQKSPLERLKMCCDMTDFSYNMLKRHILAEHKDISDGRLKFEIVKALYSDCYSDEEMARIEAHFVGDSK